MTTLDQIRLQIESESYEIAMQSLLNLDHSSLSGLDKSESFYLQAQCLRNLTHLVERTSQPVFHTIVVRGYSFTKKTPGEKYISEEPRNEEALECIEKALQFYPEYFEARLLKVQILQTIGTPYQIYEACQEACKNGFNNILLPIIQTLFDTHINFKYFRLPEMLLDSQLLEHLSEDSPFLQCYAIDSFKQLVGAGNSSILHLESIIERIKSFTGITFFSIRILCTGSDDIRVRTAAQNALSFLEDHERESLL